MIRGSSTASGRGAFRLYAAGGRLIRELEPVTPMTMYREPGVVFMPLPYFPDPRAAILLDEILLADAVRPRLLVFSGDGRRTDSIPVPDLSRSITSEMLAEVAKLAPDAAVFQRMTRAPGFPRRTPVLGDMRVDAIGGIWINEYRGPGERHSRYVVIDRTGRVLERVTFPDGAVVLNADSTRVLARMEVDLEPRLGVFSRSCAAASGQPPAAPG